MDLLKQYLVEAIQQAKGREIGILGFGAFGAVTHCALEAIGVSPHCFYDVDQARIHDVFFGKPVRPLWECVDDSAFVIDVFNDPGIMKAFANQTHMIEQEEYSSLHGLFGYKKCDIVDPLLVYNRTDDFPGFTVFGEERRGRNVLTIVALGGSTSDCSFGGLKSWPEFLHQKLTEAHIDNVVLGGGLVGYTSAQERDKFLRDVLPLEPDLVVSLSGDNDIGWSHCDPGKNHYSDYLANQIVEPIYSRCLENAETIYYGLNQKMSDAERWFQNHSILHSVAEEFGITSICFLQPCILSATYCMSDFELSWMKRLRTQGLGEHSTIARLFAHYSDFYHEVSGQMMSCDGFIDITDCFSAHSGVYIDGIHCPKTGNKILLERIAEEILRIKR